MPLIPELNKFTTIGRALANFDWNDLATGLSYNNYNFSRTSQGRFLTDISFQSAAIDASSGPSFINVSQTDIKVPTSAFQLSRVVGKGDAYVIFKAKNPTTNGTATATMTLQKYDGSTYTSISNAVAVSITINSGNVGDMAGTLTISDKVTIKRGEMLVLNVTTNTRCNVYSNGSASDSFVAVPFEV